MFPLQLNDFTTPWHHVKLETASFAPSKICQRALLSSAATLAWGQTVDVSYARSGALKVTSPLCKIDLVIKTNFKLNCLLGLFCVSIARWTKLFWIDLVPQKIKTSKVSQIILWFLLNFIKFHTWKINFTYWDDATKTCVTAYPNLVTESQKYGKSRDFVEERITLKCRFAKNIVMCMCISCQEFGKKAWERLTKSLWNTILSSDIDLLSE